LRTVSGKPSGNRNVSYVHSDAGDQFAAVHREAVRQYEHAGEIVGGKCPADCLTVNSRAARVWYALYRSSDCGCVETNRDRIDPAFDNFVATDLTVRRAPHQARIGKHFAQLSKPLAVREGFAAAEVENEIGRELRLRRLPSVNGIPA
jgi:hypothetical protein